MVSGGTDGVWGYRGDVSIANLFAIVHDSSFPLLPAPSIAYKRLGLEVSELCLVVSGRCLRVSGVEPIKDILEKILGHDTQIYPFLLVPSMV